MPRRLRLLPILLGPLGLLAPATARAAAGPPDLTANGFGIAALCVFALALLLVAAEEFTHLRKSKPMMLAAALIWVLVPLAYHEHGLAPPVDRLRENILEYAELLLFLLAAMTYINTLEERRVFGALRAWLISRGLGLRGMFWLSGALSFALSPVADNLTTALVMGAVVLSVGRGQPRFIVPACINIVVAANAGGAFSPFGDITTLMVWQHQRVAFDQFFRLFPPALVTWLLPAALMSLAVPRERPEPMQERVYIKPGAVTIIVLFVLTIAGAVMCHHFLALPPMLGMMAGLGALNFYGYFLRRNELQNATNPGESHGVFDVFAQMQRAEWDTLMFFYGVILCVGGLDALGYLALVSQGLYTGLGATAANVLLGLLSSLVDNIPVMYAVLSMHPDMPLAQWLLVTLTTGVGGSLLSIGSAAGVALMGQARGIYTFARHLRWSWAVALGYAAGVGVHLWLSGP